MVDKISRAAIELSLLCSSCEGLLIRNGAAGFHHLLRHTITACRGDNTLETFSDSP